MAADGRPWDALDVFMVVLAALMGGLALGAVLGAGWVLPGNLAGAAVAIATADNWRFTPEVDRR